MRHATVFLLTSAVLLTSACADGPVAPDAVRPSALMVIGDVTPPSDPTPPETPVSSAGCTRTQGYWKQIKHGWPDGHSRTATFFHSGGNWQAILDATPSKWPAAKGGGVYIQLGYQFIAATLNASRNGGAPAHVAPAIDAAHAYFLGTPLPGFHAEQTKNLLDRFNNGLEGVPHCR